MDKDANPFAVPQSGRTACWYRDDLIGSALRSMLIHAIGLGCSIRAILLPTDLASQFSCGLLGLANACCIFVCYRTLKTIAAQR